MNKYDYSEFQYAFKRMNGTFTYLHDIKDRDMLDSLLDIILLFFQSFVRPETLEEDLKPIIQIKGALSAKDELFLLDWCEAILAIERNVEEVYHINEQREKFENDKGLDRVLPWYESNQIVRTIR